MALLFVATWLILLLIAIRQMSRGFKAAADYQAISEFRDRRIKEERRYVTKTMHPEMEDVEVGDVVSTYDFNGQLVIEKLVLETKTPVNHNFVKVHFEDGTINENVADHPYYVVGKGWSSKRPEWTKNTHDMDCEKLEVGDICLQVSQDKSIVEQKVVRLETYQEEQKTYNLVVNDTHNYFANNILVHNKICRLCFTYDTMITLSDGTYQKISKVRPGDMIKPYNEDTGKLQNK